ncbi:zf-HC2 domain-containing protein [Nocardioides aquiterrae]|uniref:zf-HC2 domain-containing protein n=1 Tax=Nocardioides aquiterrae TaxID=203799 RepID=UPI0031D13F2B
MIGHHLGSRTSALLDGQLSPEETERAWEHVHACHQCRDLVEREGWVKTRLTGLSFDVAAPATPTGLKASLICATPGDAYLVPAPADRRRTAGLAAIGGGAVGAAVMGVLVFGVGPASAPAPSIDRRAPVTSITDAPRTPAPSVFLTRRASVSPDGTR